MGWWTSSWSHAGIYSLSENRETEKPSEARAPGGRSERMRRPTVVKTEGALGKKVLASGAESAGKWGSIQASTPWGCRGAPSVGNRVGLFKAWLRWPDAGRREEEGQRGGCGELCQVHKSLKGMFCLMCYKDTSVQNLHESSNMQEETKSNGTGTWLVTA